MSMMQWLLYNSSASPNLDGLSPYELVYGRKAKLAPDLEISVSAPVAGEYRDYVHVCYRNNLQYYAHIYNSSVISDKKC